MGPLSSFVSVFLCFCSVQEAISSLEANPAVASRLADEVLAFLTSQLTMDRVYDYMFHFIQEYSSMQSFLPDEVPHESAALVSLEGLIRMNPILKDYIPIHSTSTSTVCHIAKQMDLASGE